MEEAHGGRTELPPVVANYGLILQKYLTLPHLDLLRTVRASLRFVALMYQARAGRLYWVSATGLRDIEHIGSAFILRSTSEETLVNAKLPVRMIKGSDWSLVTTANLNLSHNTGEYTPVYDGGDWVKWDPVAGEADVPLNWYRVEDEIRGDYPAVRGPRLS